jgi:hypothetical protein
VLCIAVFLFPVPEDDWKNLKEIAELPKKTGEEINMI